LNKILISTWNDRKSLKNRAPHFQSCVSGPETFSVFVCMFVCRLVAGRGNIAQVCVWWRLKVPSLEGCRLYWIFPGVIWPGRYKLSKWTPRRPKSASFETIDMFCISFESSWLAQSFGHGHLSALTKYLSDPGTQSVALSKLLS
jgi:hypothetical protein